MKQKHRKKPAMFRDIAKERISILFEQAELRFRESPELSDRYVELARKIAMKFKVRIQKEMKRRFCKHCYKYLVPGVNCRVRLNKGKVVYYCNNCKKHQRVPYSREK
ncbi:ribonuclease P [Candidatus Woesearchaeota archaeon]|nr:ribonuclease P [Candidatus Woesearchaeota archaeon]